MNRSLVAGYLVTLFTLAFTVVAVRDYVDIKRSRDELVERRGAVEHLLPTIQDVEKRLQVVPNFTKREQWFEISDNLYVSVWTFRNSFDFDPPLRDFYYEIAGMNLKEGEFLIKIYAVGTK